MNLISPTPSQYSDNNHVLSNIRQMTDSQTQNLISEKIEEIFKKDELNGKIPIEEMQIKFKEIILKLETLLNEFKTNKKDIEIFHYEIFAEIKRNIRMRRDMLKLEIDQIADEMLNRIKLNEEFFREKIIRNKLGNLEAQIKTENKCANDIYLKQKYSKHIENMETLKSTLDKRVAELQYKINELNHTRSELKKIEFKTDSGFEMSEIFGKLELVVESEKLISCSYDKTIKIWSLSKSMCVKTLTGHTDGIKFLELLPNNRLVSGSLDKSLKIWDLKTGECLKTLYGHTYPIYCLKLLTDSCMATGSYETIKIWNYEQGVCLNNLVCDSNHTMCLEYLKDKGQLISGTYHYMKVWNLDTKKCVRQINDYTGFLCLKILPNNYLASVSFWNNIIKVWDLEKSECIRTLNGHTQNINALEFTLQGMLVSCSLDGTIKFWNIDEATCAKTLIADKKSINGLKIYDDDKLISCSSDKTIKIWDIQSGQCVQTLKGHEQGVACVILSSE